MVKDVAFKIDAATGCWNCTSHAKTYEGYPMITSNGKSTTLHRHLYMQHVGRQLPPHIEVIHTCDNPSCINLAHLREGTHIENMRDAANKNRIAHGENHPHAKLTEDAAKHIARSSATLKTLARHHGVSIQAVHAVKHGKTWWRTTGVSRR